MKHFGAKHFGANHFAATHFVLSLVITTEGNVETRIDAVKVDNYSQRVALERKRILQEQEDILVILQIWIKCV